MPLGPVKDWLVKFDVDGEVLVATDISSPASPPRVRVLPVRAHTMAEAIKIAKALYSLAT